jgi:type IV secretion system protein VirB10
VEVDDTLSEVSSKPAKNIAILAALGIASVVFLYYMIFKENPEEQAQKELQEVIDSQPVDTAQEATQQTEAPRIDIGIIDTPEVPDIGSIDLPPPPQSSTESASVNIPDPFAELEVTPIAPTTPIAPVTPTIIEPVAPAAPEQPVAAPTAPPATPSTIVVESPTEEEQVVEEEEEFEEEEFEEEEFEEEGEPELTPEQIAAIEARQSARRKSSMIVMNGGGDIDKEEAAEGEDGAEAIDGRDTKASHTSATRVGSLNNMIAQGKMMNAVLETAINTDLPGTLRAVVSRDVYAESGRNVLIPKGSRLIGSYTGGIARGQKRLLIEWSRLIRPDGVDIDIGSQGTDRLGRAGVTGNINNRYFEIFSNSILLSAIAILGASGLETLTDSQGTTSSDTTASDGTSTSSQTGSPSDFAILDAVSEINELAKEVAGDLVKMEPTITIDQGTVIKIFVNKDLIFPEETLKENVRFIQ